MTRRETNTPQTSLLFLSSIMVTVTQKSLIQILTVCRAAAEVVWVVLRNKPVKYYLQTYLGKSPH